MKYTQVVFGIPIDKAFSYRIPKKLESHITVGKRVWVSFGKRRLVGYIVGTSEKTEIENVKPIQELIDKESIISGEMLILTKWVSEYYLCSWGEAIESTIPGVLRKGKTSIKPKKPFEEEVFVPSYDLHPTTQQKTALSLIKKDLSSFKHEVFLLHGITASGKTEVYLQAISHALNQGKSSIVLVPEISLTPQAVERFKSRFGRNVAIVHSRLAGSMRFREWQRIKQGEAKVIVGVRSAVFSPAKNLGLVIVDEEHENSYKQEDTPRYHARDVAIERARINSGVAILGSATPSLESFYKAGNEEFKLIKLTKRIENKDLPKVKIIDMKREFAVKGRQTIFSRFLKDALEKTLAKKKQAILFLNRRGFSTSVICKKCGHVARCKKCDSVMVYHFNDKKIHCHYCNWKTDAPNICPKCTGAYMKFSGLGTEKVESEIARYFPSQKTGRMDTDSTRKRGSHDAILGKFSRHRIDMLVGTQMIAKGLDFPKVTLVGVVNADTSLNLPDFRASERTFSLLTQVAGRAGRGEEKGDVIIQTYTPGNYAIKTASTHDYESFYKKEIIARKELELPPFVHIIKIALHSRNNKRAEEASVKLAKALKAKLRSSAKIIGPAPAVISRLRGQYRWNIFLKVDDPLKVNNRLRKILRGKFVAVDVDPISV